MHLVLSVSVGPLRVGVQLGDPDDEEEPEQLPDSLVGDVLRLGADTAFGFTPDPLNRTWYTDDDE